MKKLLILAALWSASAHAYDALDIGVNAEVCDSWSYSVCDQPYVVDVYADYSHQLSGDWYLSARIGHKSHPERADIMGPSEDQTGHINYGSIGIKRRFQW